MKMPLLALAFVALWASTSPASEAETIKFFQQRSDRVTTDDDGHAIKLFSGGKPELSVEDLQRIGELVALEELAINAPPADDTQWKFLKSLPKLRQLTIWHGHHFQNLKAFNGLPVESITFGGCMGIRNLNKDNPDALRNAATTLSDLPNLKSLTLYHSPLTPDNSHLAHIVKHFPGLTELRVDFAAPRGQEINITAEGIAHLAELKLTYLDIENGHNLSPETFAAIAKITTLKRLHIYPARSDAYDPSMTRLREIGRNTEERSPRPRSHLPTAVRKKVAAPPELTPCSGAEAPQYTIISIGSAVGSMVMTSMIGAVTPSTCS